MLVEVVQITGIGSTFPQIRAPRVRAQGAQALF